MVRLGKIITADLQKYINRFSRYHQSILTIEQFTHFGRTANPQESFKFLRHEVPIRLAHIMQEINYLPKNLLSMYSVDLVRGWYAQSFLDLMEFQDLQANAENIDKFTRALHTIKRRHDNTVETMAQGIIELREAEGESAVLPAVQYFLDRFYMNRIGIRLLMTQHLALFKEDLTRSSKSRFIGVFEPNCKVKSIVEDAVENAGLLCDQAYFTSPKVIIKENNTVNKGSEVITSYVPSHLYYMLFELLKNSMRATVETHEKEDELPPVTVDVVKGSEDLTVKISDFGGGIKRSQIKQLFMYHYSTAPEPNQLAGSPLAGYGYGLPLSKLYAKYFGGDIQMVSIQGLGTSAYVYLKALSQDAHEVIPLYNSTAAKASYAPTNSHQSAPRDWSCDSFYDDEKSSFKHR